VSGRTPPVLAARVESAGTTAAPGGQIKYTVLNTGALPIMLGAHYELDRFIDNTWEPFPLPYAFRLWGRRLETGNRYELTARIPEHAPPGRYRLRKRLDVDRDPHPGYESLATKQIDPIELTTEFDVQPP
jgi:hypothetical protein